MKTEIGKDCILNYTLDGQPHSVVLDRPRMVIGRAPNCDVVLQTKNVSRNHASIAWEDDGWVIADMGSSNGTYVNQVRVTKQKLQHNDIISLGVMDLHFCEPPAQAAPPADGAAVGMEPTGRFPAEKLRNLAPGTPAAAGPPSMSTSVVIDESVHRSAKMTSVLNASDFDGLLSGEAVASRLQQRPAPTASSRSKGAPVIDGMLLEGVGRVLRLFSQASKALLASTGLEELLPSILGLMFDSLPAERGMVALYEDATDSVVPKAVRTRSGESESELRISRTIVNEAIQARNAVLVADTGSDARFSAQQSIVLGKIHSAMCAPMYHAGKVHGLLYVDTQRALRPFTPEDLELLATLAALAAVGIEQTRLRENITREQKIRERLERYSSPGVVDRIILSTGSAEGEMIAEEKDVSILFADLSGFTPMSERMTPAQVAKILNSLFEKLTDVIFQQNGTLDKYMGDALMAIFGAPLAYRGHAQRAVQAALLMQREIQRFNQTSGFDEKIAMRIGINSGTVIAGDIGSPKRKDYTVIGDAVNIASRLESGVAKPGQVVIGPSTYEQVQTRFDCKPLPQTKLKGKEQLIVPYLVAGVLKSGTEKPGAPA